MDAHTRVQERELTQALSQIVVAEFCLSEGLFRRQEGDRCTRSVRYTDFFQWVIRNTVRIFLLVQLTAATNGQLQLLRQRVYYRDTYTVQTAGYLVGVVIELTARVEYRQNNLCSRYALFRVKLGRNTTTVIGDRD